MRIVDYYHPREVVFSVELYPPKTKLGMQALLKDIPAIIAQNIRFISVTYGAGGSSQHGTLEISRSLAKALHQGDALRTVMAHLTCVSHSKQEVKILLQTLQRMGVENIMALRGDPPSGDTQFTPSREGFAYAIDLVRYIREYSTLGIGVAGYPEGHAEAASYQTSLQHQIQKIHAGGEFIISQFFTNNDHFLKWRDDLRQAKIEIPIVAGILPALSSKQISKFARMCGVEVEKPLYHGLERYAAQPKSAAQFGLEYALKQIEMLLREGVQGIHLYALNRLDPIRAAAGVFKNGSSA